MKSLKNRIRFFVNENEKIMCEKALVCFVFVTRTFYKLSTQRFPYNLPANLKANVNVNTTEKEPSNNLQLGTNIHGISSSEEKAFFNMFDPITVRFPHAVWSNWYDWRRDVSRVFGKLKIKQFKVNATAENGTVMRNPDKEIHDINSTVSLIATLAGGYKIVSWSGDYVGSENPLSIEVKDPFDIHANFALVSTGIMPSTANSIQVSPNQGTFSIKLDTKENAQYKRYTLSGVKIQNDCFVTETSTQLVAKNKGVYILEVISKQPRITQKIIINSP